MAVERRPSSSRVIIHQGEMKSGNGSELHSRAHNDEPNSTARDFYIVSLGEREREGEKGS